MHTVAQATAASLPSEQTPSHPCTMSDQSVYELINVTSVHADKPNFDEDSLYIIVENILKCTIQIADNFVKGSNVNVDHIEEKTPKPNFTAPLCTLKSISCELSCKSSGLEITRAILTKLSSYSWKAKAVLTLAAFALEFGDFWLLFKPCLSEPLVKNLAVLKGMPALNNSAELQNRKQAFVHISTLIRDTVQVITIFKKLSNYRPKDDPKLSSAMEHMPVDLFWAILTIAACAVKVSILANNKPDEPDHDLGHYTKKIHSIINRLKAHLKEAEDVEKIRKLLRDPTEVTEILKAIFFTTDNVKPLIDGSTQEKKGIDVLRNKNVFLFISSLNISDELIAILYTVYEKVKEDDKNYAIVWIPIVEGVISTEQGLQQKYDILKAKMKWYIVDLQISPFSTVCIRFLQEDWHFQWKPMLVAMSAKGRVENLNALPLICSTWRIEAFPFNRESQEKISKEITSFTQILGRIYPIIEPWVNENKYILFYGGQDKDVIEKFKENATRFATESVLKKAQISIELLRLENRASEVDQQGQKGIVNNIVRDFWNSIESLFLTNKTQDKHDKTTTEIQTLLSYKNGSCWAVLIKGTRVVIISHGTPILKVIEDVEKWKDNVEKNDFEAAFIEYYNEVIKFPDHKFCCHLNIPNGIANSFPGIMKCAECSQAMVTSVTYTCCHD